MTMRATGCELRGKRYEFQDASNAIRDITHLASSIPDHESRISFLHHDFRGGGSIRWGLSHEFL